MANKLNHTMKLIQDKRLDKENKILNDPANFKHYATAYQDKQNPLVWYVLIIGDPEVDMYAGGEYIFKIHHAEDYPKSPPDYYSLTPSGRFDVNRKICMTNSSYHKDTWSPTWNILTLIDGVNSIWYQDDTSGISHITSGKKDYVPPEMKNNRKNLAKQSIEYNKKHLKEIYNGFDRNKLMPWPESKKK